VSSGANARRADLPIVRQLDLWCLAIAGAWAGIVLAVQRWVSWDEAIRLQFAADMRSYEVIARAAPSLPHGHIVPQQHAERFPVHWLIGTISSLGNLPLHAVYRVATLLILALVLYAVHGVLTQLALTRNEYALALGAVAASAYPVHYLLSSPGMVVDGLFVLGLSVALLGFARGQLAVVVGGLLLAEVGRQTALPVAFAAALWAAFAPAWRHARWRAAALCAGAPLVLFLTLHFVAERFATTAGAGVTGGSVGETFAFHLFETPHSLAHHLGRVAAGIVIPCALIAGAWLRTRHHVPRGPLLLAAVIVAQPLLLTAATGGGEPRLAALATPALAVAAGALLRGSRLQVWETAVVAVAIFAGGLHHRYTYLSFGLSGWLALEFAGAAVIVAVLARPAASGLLAARTRTA
jgi:hypothetical protein